MTTRQLKKIARLYAEAIIRNTQIPLTKKLTENQEEKVGKYLNELADKINRTWTPTFHDLDSIVNYVKETYT